MRILLDTSAYSAFKRGHESTLNLIRQSEEIFFSSVVAGELLAGFRFGKRFQMNYDELKEFITHRGVNFLPVTLATAERYGRIYTNLRKHGTPIPTNDMWVAAHTFEAGADLVTMDRHFNLVENLPLLTIDA